MGDIEYRVAPKIVDLIEEGPTEQFASKTPDFGSDFCFFGEPGTQFSMTREQRLEWSLYAVHKPDPDASTNAQEDSKLITKVAQALLAGEIDEGVKAALELYDFCCSTGDPCYGAFRLGSVYELIGDIPRAIERYSESVSRVDGRPFPAYRRLSMARLAVLQEA